MNLCLLHQFFMPISSFPVSMPWAWCRVAWVRTHQCILWLELPWSIQRRPNPNRGASLSFTTLMVRSRFSLFFLQLLFCFPYSLQHCSIHVALPFLSLLIILDSFSSPPLIVSFSFIQPFKGALLALSSHAFIKSLILDLPRNALPFPSPFSPFASLISF